MRLDELYRIALPRRKKKRLGRGLGSGRGKTSGRGTKGQWAREGVSLPRGFEGGQMPLLRRLPKRGFNNARFREERAEVVNLGALNAFRDGTRVDPKVLFERGLVSEATGRVKVLGDGTLRRKLVVAAHAFSASARAGIEKAGGTVESIGGPASSRPAAKPSGKAGGRSAAPPSASSKPPRPPAAAKGERKAPSAKKPEGPSK